MRNALYLLPLLLLACANDALTTPCTVTADLAGAPDLADPARPARTTTALVALPGLIADLDASIGSHSIPGLLDATPGFGVDNFYPLVQWSFGYPSPGSVFPPLAQVNGVSAQPFPIQLDVGGEALFARLGPTRDRPLEGIERRISDGGRLVCDRYSKEAPPLCVVIGVLGATVAVYPEP